MEAACHPRSLQAETGDLLVNETAWELTSSRFSKLSCLKSAQSD